MKKTVLLLLLGLFLTTGCFFRFGGEESGRRQVSVGKQLRELKRAREAGAISEQEYRELKKGILREYGVEPMEEGTKEKNKREKGK